MIDALKGLRPVTGSAYSIQATDRSPAPVPSRQARGGPDHGRGANRVLPLISMRARSRILNIPVDNLFAASVSWTICDQQFKT